LDVAETSALNAAIDAALLTRIEDAGLNASAPPQQRWMDGWLLRFSPGKAKRARCVNAVAAGRRPVADKLAECAALFEGVGLPFIVRVTPFTLPPQLDADLDELGLRQFDDTRVMVLPTLSALEPPTLESHQSVRSIGLEAFAQHVGALRGSPLAQRQAHAQRLVNSPVPFFAFEMRIHGEVAVCGQFALEGDLVGLYDVFTAPEARSRGLARTLCQSMLAEARGRGAGHAYLQVESDNVAARAVYFRLGFADGYGYHYRTRDPSAA